jgi:hypothetical protein
MAAQLAAFDALETSVLYAAATNAERVVMEAAVAQSPRRPVKRGDSIVWEAVIDPHQIAAAQAARRAAAHPDIAAQIARLERVRNVYVGVASAATALVQ